MTTQKKSVVQERAQRALKFMRTGSSLGDFYSTAQIMKAVGLNSSAACSAVMKELHDRSLVEPGRRSMWRLTAHGRNTSVQCGASKPKSGNFDADFDRRTAVLRVMVEGGCGLHCRVDVDWSEQDLKLLCTKAIDLLKTPKGRGVEIQFTAQNGTEKTVEHERGATAKLLMQTFKLEWGSLAPTKELVIEPPIARQAAAALQFLRSELDEEEEFANSVLRKRAGDAETPSQLSNVLRFLEAHGFVRNVRRGTWCLTRTGKDPASAIVQGPRSVTI